MHERRLRQRGKAHAAGITNAMQKGGRGVDSAREVKPMQVVLLILLVISRGERVGLFDSGTTFEIWGTGRGIGNTSLGGTEGEKENEKPVGGSEKGSLGGGRRKTKVPGKAWGGGSNLRDEVDSDFQSRGSGPFAAASLQHVKLPVLNCELHVLRRTIWYAPDGRLCISFNLLRITSMS